MTGDGFRRLIEGYPADDGVLIHDETGRIRAANATAVALLGESEGQVFQTSPWPLVDEAGHPLADQTWPAMTTLTDGTARKDLLKLPPSDGKTTWLSVWARAVPHPEGSERRAAMVLVRDVTEQVEVMQVRHRIRGSLSQIPVGVLVEDPQRKIVMTNPWFHALFDVPGGPGSLDGQDAVAAIASLPAWEESGLPYHFRTAPADVPKDGQRDEMSLPDGRTIEVGCFPGFDPDGEPVGHIWTFRDETDRRRTELRLRMAKKRLRETIHHLPIGMVILDPMGRIEECNPAAGRILQLDDATGTHTLVSDAMGLRVDVTPEEAAYVRARTGRKPSEVLLTTRLGAMVPIEIAVAMIDTVHGERYVVSLQDVSERHAVGKLKDDFVGSVNHALRTPLTAIRGALGLLKAGIGGPFGADATDLIHLAERMTQHLISRINDLLDLESQEDEAATSLYPRYFPLAGMVQDALVFLDPNAEDRARIQTRELDRWLVWGDRDRLIQVMVHLLSNALKYAPAGTPIEVAVVGKAGGIEVRISDRGPGIPSGQHVAVFDPFQRLANSTGDMNPGLGIGLTICQAIVRQHAGTIGVRDRVGGGTVFWFDLPEAKDTTVIPAAGPTAHILLVDPDPALTEIQAKQLQLAGWSVIQANNLPDAVTRLNDFRPAIAIVGFDGEDTLGRAFLQRLGQGDRRDRPAVLIMADRDVAPDDLPDAGPRRLLVKARVSDAAFVGLVGTILAERIKGDVA